MLQDKMLQDKMLQDKAVDSLLRLRRYVRDVLRSPVLAPVFPALQAVDLWVRQRLARNGVVVERRGIQFELDLTQQIDSAIFYDGYFELGTTEAIERIVEAGMVVFDIGANIGCHALQLARLVGPAGHVWAFEPTGWATKKLRRNLELNPDLAQTLNIVNCALSDETRARTEYSFRSQWNADGKQTAEEHGEVDFITLDEFVHERGVTSLDFVKLDVDGYETKILRGARETLKRFKPAMIIEVSDYWQRRVGDSLDALVCELERVGYRYYDEAGFEPIDDLRDRVAQLGGRATFNVVCVAPADV
ncbi:MAG: FkbM family methyltransferase [Myxococcales bacterium]|nr:FkbM family methyltransferase [Myxococcales bacterium]